MQDNEIIELVLSKEDDILKIFADQLPGETPDISVTEQYKAKQQINTMLILIAHNCKRAGGYRRPTIEVPPWPECKNNIKKCGNMNKNWEICGILDLDSIFNSEEAQKNCFEFVSKTFKNTTKTYSIILK